MTKKKKRLIEQVIKGVLSKNKGMADKAIKGLVNMRLAAQMAKAARKEDLI